MRIIAGKQNRRKISAPAGLNTRPILDRVKQALFDALGAHYGTLARLPELNVLDVFCGGGTLGIEALSRGAASCIFVERERVALQCLRDNLKSLELMDRGSVRAGSALSVDLKPEHGPAGLIFLDPPFPMSSAFSPTSELGRIFIRLAREIPLTDDCLCIWRYEAGFHAPEIPAAGWRTFQRRTYGRNELSWLIRDDAAQQR